MTSAQRLHAEMRELDGLPDRIRALRDLLDADIEQRGTDHFHGRLSKLADEVEVYGNRLYQTLEDALVALDGDMAAELRLLDGAAAA